MSELDAIQKQAWRFYKEWQTKRPYPYCEALKCEVKITKKGWEHLRGSRRATKRDPKDTIHRYGLLKYAPDIITTGKFAGRRPGGYVFLQKDYGERIYRVVLVEEGKNLTFISIIEVT